MPDPGAPVLCEGRGFRHAWALPLPLGSCAWIEKNAPYLHLGTRDEEFPERYMDDSGHLSVETVQRLAMEQLARARARAGPAQASEPANEALDEGVIDRTRVYRPGQLTDAYLLALAARHCGRVGFPGE
jgi:hypothetical protein